MTSSPWHGPQQADPTSSSEPPGPRDPDRPMLRRPRLLLALHARFRVRLMTLTAGPGFGKTTLLDQAMAENALAPHGLDVRLTCTERDQAASSLAGSLGKAFRLPGAVTWEPDVIVERLVAAVWAAAPRQVALIIDEAHLVARGSPGANLLRTVLRRLPANGHLVLAARDRLPIATARLASLGQLSELRETDLAFSPDEVAAFADLRGAASARLDTVGGWPALVELAASVGDDRKLDYLWEELLESLTEDRRRDLASLSLVDAFDETIADALVDHPIDLTATLADLPLVSGHPGGERALHPLWRPALADILSSHEQAAARSRAAETLRQRGALADAAALLIEANEWQKVRSIGCETALRTHPLVAPDVIDRWWRALPAHERRTPEGVLMQALVMRAHDLERALPLFLLAANRFQDSGDVIGVVAALTHGAHIAWWLDDVDSVEAATSRVERYADELPWLRGVAALGRALAADARGETQVALDILVDVDPSLVPPTMTAGLDWAWAWNWLFAGRPQQSLRYAEAAVDNADGTFLAPALNLLLLSRWFGGERSEALDLVPRFAEATEATGRDLGTAFERSQCALLLAIAGHVDEARRHLAVAGQAMPGAGHAPMAKIARAMAVSCVRIDDGDEQGARRELAAEFARETAIRTGATRWHLLFPALSYVLVPDIRDRWDDLDLGQSQVLALQLARALVAVRDAGDVSPAAALPWDTDEDQFGAHIPVPWLAELAIAAVAGGCVDAVRSLRRLGSPGRSWMLHVASHARPAIARTARSLVAEQPVAANHRLSLNLLGPLEVLRDDIPIAHPDLRRERVRQLLQYLVFRSPVSRATVGAELWPDLEPDAAGRNLRVTLSYLQGVLEPDRDEGAPPWFLKADGGRLRLRNDDSLRVDAYEFESAIDAAQQAERSAAPSLVLEHLQRALRFYRGDALTELSGSDWADIERDRLRVHFVAATVRCGELLLAAGDEQTPLDLAVKALRADPHSEAAYALLAAIHLERGELDAARYTYRRCLDMLSQLGLPPGPAIQMVARRLQPVARLSARQAGDSSRTPAPRRQPKGAAHDQPR